MNEKLPISEEEIFVVPPPFFHGPPPPHGPFLPPPPFPHPPPPFNASEFNITRFPFPHPHLPPPFPPFFNITELESPSLPSTGETDYMTYEDPVLEVVVDYEYPEQETDYAPGIFFLMGLCSSEIALGKIDCKCLGHNMLLEKVHIAKITSIAICFRRAYDYKFEHFNFFEIKF